MKTRATALAVVASLALVACGDDKDTAVTTTAAPVETAAPTTAAAPGDIVAVAAGNADFSTLVAAVKAAGLVDKLLLPENKAVLTQILTYHVVAGKVMAADAMKLDGKAAKTVNGADAKIMKMGTTLMIANAHVAKADIVAKNGVIHVVDAVMLPPAK